MLKKKTPEGRKIRIERLAQQSEPLLFKKGGKKRRQDAIESQKDKTEKNFSEKLRGQACWNGRETRRQIHGDEGLRRRN